MKRSSIGLSFLLAAAACAQPEASDKPLGPVVDEADILPPEREARLDRKLREHWAKSGTSIIVYSVPSLRGEPIEDVATRTFNEWGIGDAKTNRGLLILVAPNERKVRIEVGYGLECIITNPVAGRIIDIEMIPLFRTGDMAGATEAGVDGLIRDVAKGAVDDPMFPGCKKELDKAA